MTAERKTYLENALGIIADDLVEGNYLKASEGFKTLAAIVKNWKINGKTKVWKKNGEIKKKYKK